MRDVHYLSLDKWNITHDVQYVRFHLSMAHCEYLIS
jgi:hypothetical protein